MKRRLSNIWQFISSITLSIFDRSVELHLPKGRVIQTGWPGETRLKYRCIATITAPLKKISGEFSKEAWSSDPRYNFFRSIIEGKPPEADPYFLSIEFKNENQAQTFLRRQKEILGLALEGEQHFDIAGVFWVDGSIRLLDGNHRLMALAALGKRQIRLGIVLEKPINNRG